MSKRMVIDACVAISASKSEHPISKKCRVFLDQFRKDKNTIVSTPEISTEWKGASHFSKIWLSSMISRGQYQFLKNVRNTKFRNKIDNLDINIQTYNDIKKDICLIEAANASDNIIISKDNNARDYFQGLVEFDEKLLDNIVWVNPIEDHEKPLEWLSLGAPASRERQLGSVRLQTACAIDLE